MVLVNLFHLPAFAGEVVTLVHVAPGARDAAEYKE
jgi:hypothetical protein